MRRRAVTCRCLLVLAPALLAVHPGCRTSGGRTGSLAGTVREAGTKAPIDGAEVTVGAAIVYTDARGQFTMDDLDAGDRPASVTAPGYHTLTQTVTIEAGDNTVVLELHRLGISDGGLADGPASDGPPPDGPAPQDGGQDGPSCAGSSCTYGYAYGQCCAAAPYCANYYGASSLVCRATCGATNERCGYHPDCCDGNCVSGYCAEPSCAGNACSYGYTYGGCCAAAPYCANYYGASSLVCRSTCGALNERCAYSSDCCNNNCVSGYCAQPSCAGTSCTAGYANGGCCASAPYCTHYWSQPTICQATCGAASQHCQATSDCCSGLQCIYNSSALWNICTQL